MRPAEYTLAIKSLAPVILGIDRSVAGVQALQELLKIKRLDAAVCARPGCGRRLTERQLLVRKIKAIRPSGWFKDGHAPVRRHLTLPPPEFCGNQCANIVTNNARKKPTKLSVAFNSMHER